MVNRPIRRTRRIHRIRRIHRTATAASPFEIAALDLPTGPTIVCLFGVTLLLCAGLAWKKKQGQAQPGKT